MTAPTIPQMARYRQWLSEQRGLNFPDYEALRQWSVRDLDAFWQSIWDYFDLRSPTPHRAVLAQRKMPGAVWFPGAQVNYARQVLRHVEAAHAAGQPAIVACGEDGVLKETSWPELRRKAAALAIHLKAQGVRSGDRVAAYLPNIPETIIAFLATASIGAVWSVCAPDMAAPAVIDRFKQIEPKILIACDGVTYAGRRHDRRQVIDELRQALPSVEHVIIHSDGANAPTAPTPCCRRSCRRPAPRSTPSSRNGCRSIIRSGSSIPAAPPDLPKPIVHGHGGVVIVALPLNVLHNDIGCSYRQESFGERYHWYSSTGWIMWNCQVAGLLNGTTICIFDGSPGGSKEKPDWETLWRFVSNVEGDVLRRRRGVLRRLHQGRCRPRRQRRPVAAARARLDRIAALRRHPAMVQRALRRASPRPTAARRSATCSGPTCPAGTDFAGAFIGANPELPQTPGLMQCRLLGAAVEAFNEQGRGVIEEVGELVCTEPMPSMPLKFWNDEGDARYRGSYFDTYPDNFDGSGRGAVWRHGDWLKINTDGSCVIYGRSDATINRHGLRMGTSELYSAIEALPEVLDSMVVDLEYLGRESYMPLFVVLREGITLDRAMQARINNAIEAGLSRRFLPNEIFAVAEIPRTLSGKKQELPIKKLLLGQPLEKVINKDAMANPGCLAWYLDFAAKHLQKQAGAA